MEEKTAGQKLMEELSLRLTNGTIRLSDEELTRADAFCEEYKAFLDQGKTERECVDFAVGLLSKKGFKKFVPGTVYRAGEKVYCSNRGKAVLAAVIGTEPIEKGVRIAAAHIDSPRIDLKQKPLYEDKELALFKTHYYGGIKKYQWVSIPLALHGVVIRKDGSSVTVKIGEDQNDPVFCITDLLPHLSTEQYKRTPAELIKGEELNLLIGSRCFRDEKAAEKVKLNILKLLKEKYGLIEADFLSAELEIVPAFKAKDVGFDRSMIGAYGHDDRVCAYPALMAAIDCAMPRFTTVTVLTDKEEIGSVGNTGLNSSYLSYFIADLASGYGVPERTVLSASKCLSADVNAAFDPTFPDVVEKLNGAYLNYGVVLTKYTGSRGKAVRRTPPRNLWEKSVSCLTTGI